MRLDDDDARNAASAISFGELSAIVANVRLVKRAATWAILLNDCKRRPVKFRSAQHFDKISWTFVLLATAAGQRRNRHGEGHVVSSLCRQVEGTGDSCEDSHAAQGELIHVGVPTVDPPECSCGWVFRCPPECGKWRVVLN